uniref:Uncharacterized protein n=1 Tax=Stomoxys calcitrans TaxID=35570 RepID=A0A1I8Q3M3_STOCA
MTTHANANSSTTHSDLTGKSSNLSNSHETATTITTSCSVCPSGSCLNFSSTEESDRDFDAASVSPMCHCDFDCGDNLATASLTATSPTTVANDNCTLSSSNSVMNLRTISPFPHANTTNSRHQRHHHMLPSPFMRGATTSASSCNIASAITSANTCATGPATANSTYLCSTSAPTGASLTTRSLLHRITSSHNNNTCSINNNSTSTTTTTLCSLANKTPPASASAHNNSITSRGGFAGFFSSNHSRCTSKTDVNECHQQQQQTRQKPQQLQLQQQHNHLSQQHHHHQHNQNQRHHHHHNHHQQHHHNHPNDHNHQPEHFDNNECKQLKSSDSLSDVSDTFEWWFQRHKRNSTKKSSSHSSTSQLNLNIGFNLTSTHRSSPVSSCCGSSSHGRSSPDTDTGEPPALPLSPG